MNDFGDNRSAQMSRIMSENNEQEPIEIYHTWGRWRIIRSRHSDAKGTREQYTLQRYSDSKRHGVVWHMVAFFWSIEDLDDFIEFLTDGAGAIEQKDGEQILKREIDER